MAKESYTDTIGDHVWRCRLSPCDFSTTGPYVELRDHLVQVHKIPVSRLKFWNDRVKLVPEGEGDPK